MAKRAAGAAKMVLNNNFRGKGTSIGNRNLKMSSMNKSKRANFKKYRGQGRTR